MPTPPPAQLPAPLRRVLVANRAEIAVRILRTCRDLGIDTVAVHSDPDATAAHVRAADLAVRLPGATPAETYLRADLLVKAALAAGADAVHPGYGFLSENASFAEAVLAAGLRWIGPPPAAIEAMASKTRARELMGLAPPPRIEEITAADLPLLVKAAAGGGGRGMRIVRDLTGLEDALAAARAEALAAFGDGEVFTEPYIEDARHVEVQLLADTHGTVWTLGTRDCSLQRRHQKVIEECPAPGLPAGTATRLEALATEAARAVGYTGAGTVEFLVEPSGRPHFLEMNTRLQVEHPVTEAVFGIDLVALQFRIAEGRPLPATPPQPRGHAVEARLYAEDPARDFAPRTGTLHRFRVPGAADPAAPGLRVDAGYADGDEITVHYDPLLAKVIAHAPTRDQAVRRLAHALRRAEIHGPVTNRAFLVRSLEHPGFATAARIGTGFYDRPGTLPAELGRPFGGEEYAAIAAALATAARTARTGPPTARLGGWRNLRSGAQTRSFGTHEIRYTPTRSGGYELPGRPGVRVVRAGADAVALDIDGVTTVFRVARHGPDEDVVYVDTARGAHALTERDRLPVPEDDIAPGSLLAPMPGTVVRIADGVAEGARVVKGQPLLWLEAMKMEHQVEAPVTGTLVALPLAPGHTVTHGTLLATLTPDPS
ncbi:acetyl/propionyl/methylcrotonyl-CoA carboxylase subunit alpha [Streptomyces sp. NPDC057638]|uniref:acetyl/propionyl/methylcrotonyl-CoA carboxylase subunit alpha n=1 Tax=Streptomyces sp. NPDC057638 TaxID=3346190 RepID=UPI0036AAC640